MSETIKFVTDASIPRDELHVRQGGELVAKIVNLASPVLGYVLYAEKYDVIYKSHVYPNEDAAKRALAGVVWHNRGEYSIRPITLTGSASNG